MKSALHWYLQDMYEKGPQAICNSASKIDSLTGSYPSEWPSMATVALVVISARHGTAAKATSGYLLRLKHMEGLAELKILKRCRRAYAQKKALCISVKGSMTYGCTI